MTSYTDSLQPWVLYCTQSLPHRLVQRFHKRSDADGHLQVLQRLMPHNIYQVVFDQQPTAPGTLKSCNH